MIDKLDTYLFVSEKVWHDELFKQLKSAVNGNWIRCSVKEDFNSSTLSKIKPERIFIPHWSYIIPEDIYAKYECIVFHMTDLPYGRGGSPLQNLILRRKTKTKISALRVEKGIDVGPIYLKKELFLDGTAQEIFERASDIIKDMIIEIISTNPIPKPQSGDIVVFKRRRPNENTIEQISSPVVLYDYIRMLDADGYPKAFMENDHFRFEFTKAIIEEDNSVTAHVRIFPK